MEEGECGREGGDTEGVGKGVGDREDGLCQWWSKKEEKREEPSLFIYVPTETEQAGRWVADIKNRCPEARIVCHSQWWWRGGEEAFLC